MMFGSKTRRLEERAAALEAVLFETRLATGLVMTAVGSIAARHDPGILDELAEALAAMSSSRPDEWESVRLAQARAEAAEILRDAAKGARGGSTLLELLQAQTKGGMQ